MDLEKNLEKKLKILPVLDILFFMDLEKNLEKKLKNTSSSRYFIF